MICSSHCIPTHNARMLIKAWSMPLPVSGPSPVQCLSCECFCADMQWSINGEDGLILPFFHRNFRSAFEWAPMPELSCKTSKGHVENRTSSANPSVSKGCRPPSRNERPKVRNHPSWITSHETTSLAPAFTICWRFASKTLRFAEALRSNMASMDSFTPLVTVADSITLYGGVISIVVSVDAIVYLCCPFRSSLRFFSQLIPVIVIWLLSIQFLWKGRNSRSSCFLIWLPFCFASQEREFQSNILF